MDGATWYALAEEYVNAINGGTFPNIESSWIYIQKAKARSLYDDL